MRAFICNQRRYRRCCPPDEQRILGLLAASEKRIIGRIDETIALAVQMKAETLSVTDVVSATDVVSLPSPPPARPLRPLFVRRFNGVWYHCYS